MKNLKKQFKRNSVIIIIIFFSTLARALFLDSYPAPLHIDEGLMTSAAISLIEQTQHPFETFYSITVIGNILTAIFLYLFGTEPGIIRLQSVIFGSFSVIFIYLLVKDLFNQRTGIIAAVLAGSSHVLLAYSRTNFPNIQAVFFITASLYIANKIKDKDNLIFPIFSGAFAALSFYSYTGAKIILPITILFLTLYWNKDKWKHYLAFFVGAAIICFPLVIYIIQPNSNFLEREAQVTVFSNSQIFFDKWGTTSMIKILFLQFKENFIGFFTLKDNSNQYGNSPLLDPLSSTVFILFIVYCTVGIIKRTINKITLFILLCIFGVVFLVSFTESPPLSTRLILCIPFVLIGISLFLTSFLKSSKQALIFQVVVVCAIALLNLKLYFYDYSVNNRAYYNWIEPNGSIGAYASTLSGKVYLLATPHTYSAHPVIHSLTYKKTKVSDLNLSQLLQVLQTPNTTLIIPIDSTQKSSTLYFIEKEILPKATHSIVNFHSGIPCVGCTKTSIFVSISQ